MGGHPQMRAQKSESAEMYNNLTEDDLVKWPQARTPRITWKGARIQGRSVHTRQTVARNKHLVLGELY